MQTMTQQDFFAQSGCPLTKEQLAAHKAGKPVIPTEEQLKWIPIGVTKYNLTNPIIKMIVVTKE